MSTTEIPCSVCCNPTRYVIRGKCSYCWSIDELSRMRRIERELSVLVSEHENGGPAENDWIINCIVGLLEGGPYER